MENENFLGADGNEGRELVRSAWIAISLICAGLAIWEWQDSHDKAGAITMVEQAKR